MIKANGENFLQKFGPWAPFFFGISKGLPYSIFRCEAKEEVALLKV